MGNPPKKKEKARPHQRQHPQKPRFPILWKLIAVAGLALCGMIVVLLVKRAPQSDISLKIGDQTVPSDVFCLVMQQNRSEVVSMYTSQGLSTAQTSFWRTEVEGKSPARALLDDTMQELQELAAAYQLAQSCGFGLDGGLGGVTERMETENALRSAKLEAGEHVYGLQSYTLQTYLSYETDWIASQYCSDAAYPGMDISQSQLYEYYQEHLDQYQKYDDISFSYLKVDLNQLDDDQKQVVQTQAAQLAQEMTQGKELQQQVAAYHALTPYMTHVDILSDQVASYSRAIGDVMELGWDLQPGEDTGLVELNGYLFLVQCTSRVEYDYQPFEQVQSVILSQMRKERYETLLQQTADSLTIEADLTELESFIIQEMEDANGK